MIRPFKLYDLNSKRMIYAQDAYRMGIFLAPDGRPVQLKGGAIVHLQQIDVLHITGWIDTMNRPIWEHDVVDVDIVHDFEGIESLTRGRGVVIYDPMIGGFHVKLDAGALQDEDAPIVRMTIIGDVYGQRGK